MTQTTHRLQAATGSLVSTAVRKRKRRKRNKNQLAAVEEVIGQQEIRWKLANMTTFHNVSFPTVVGPAWFVDQSIQDKLWAICGFDSVRPPQSNPITRFGRGRLRKQAAEHYAKCLNRLVEEREAYKAFFTELARATTLFHDGDATRSVVSRWGLSGLSERHERFVEAVLAKRKFSLPLPSNRLDIEELSGDLPLVWERLRKLLLSSLEKFQYGLGTALSHLSTLSVFGAINWFEDDPPSCRAAFFTQTARFKGAAQASEIELVECAALHSVSLINTRRAAASPTTGLFESRHPTRITRLLEKLPESLKGRLSVVHGTRIRSLTVEQEIRPIEKIVIAPPEPRYRVHADPLLVWNKFVLCGWEPEEALKERDDPVLGQFPYLVR